ncbi:anaerobic selenocysteine-containing dehydrogenase [Rhodoligotrophos appendicifer]|uniref:molybdopterin-containing oxidoreductase family protein n=1 Tax=Rhodoligotrophos appendicifer TaxID=987056 RepID=UPI00117DFE09|nr:molybdopterin oxidoreductase family protein [Rhodoligotrophos appendicifer]
MNIRQNVKIGHTACPHDCPSTCALDVELFDDRTIGRVRGAQDNDYTLGVICAKVARYAERIHHPDRLTKPLKRKGSKGSGEWMEIGFDDALDEVAEAFIKAEATYGAESVWPYYYAGTMGLVMRDGINRLRHVKNYSGMYDTFCVTLSWPGMLAGVGKLAGPDPREMSKSDLVVIWGTNPVNTQVNVMSHALKARKERGAKIAVVDIYETATIKQADIGLIIRPGTDGALACAIMHVLFRDGYANWPYLEKYSDCPRDFEAHLRTRTPEWAAAITGASVEEIESFARVIGERPRAFFRIGYGFSRSRNGSVNVHAVTCIPTVTGAWLHEGGGALHSNSAIYHMKKSMIEGLDAMDPSVRMLEQGRLGAVLLGDENDLRGGPPVKAMLFQNTNPVSVAPDQTRVKQGMAREDLFVCVHEQFMTETAQMADIVLPATMFMEHDDIYVGSGHQYLIAGPKIVEAPGECRSNHDVISGLAGRLGAEHPGFKMSPRELIDWTLKESGWGNIETLEKQKWIDCQPDFETSHFVKGFGQKGGKFRFRPEWRKLSHRPRTNGPLGPIDDMPEFPDHWAVIEEATESHPFRLATSPARSFLNSTFNETPTSVQKEVRPELLINPADVSRLNLVDGQKVKVGNDRGTVTLHAKSFAGVKPGVVIAESIWPNSAFEDGQGINTLTGADQPAPLSGCAFHDNRVWIRAA